MGFSEHAFEHAQDKHPDQKLRTCAENGDGSLKAPKLQSKCSKDVGSQGHDEKLEPTQSITDITFLRASRMHAVSTLFIFPRCQPFQPVTPPTPKKFSKSIPGGSETLTLIAPPFPASFPPDALLSSRSQAPTPKKHQTRCKPKTRVLVGLASRLIPGQTQRDLDLSVQICLNPTYKVSVSLRVFGAKDKLAATFWL